KCQPNSPPPLPLVHDQHAYNDHHQHRVYRQLEQHTGRAKWTVPLIFSISQVLKIGKQPVSIQLGGKYYVDTPRYGPDWGVRLNFTLLYPTARPKPGPIPGTYSK